MSLPNIPKTAFSHLGELSVTLEKGLTEGGAMGRTSMIKRAISLDDAMHPSQAWLTYWHEVFHVILHDSGLDPLISSKLTESLCDAFGSYLTAAMRAGFIEVKAEQT